MERESSIKQIINSSLEQIRAIIDADTVVGKQIITPSGTVIIPISKISMGFASGGLDLPDDSNDDTKNFGGGGGTGVSVHPIGFLTVYPDGKVEMLPLIQEKATALEQVAELLENAPAIINKVKGVLLTKQAEETEEEVAALEEEYAAKLAEEAPKKMTRAEKKAEKAAEKAAKKAEKKL